MSAGKLIVRAPIEWWTEAALAAKEMRTRYDSDTVVIVRDGERKYLVRRNLIGTTTVDMEAA